MSKFEEIIDLILKEDPRFARGAYFFVREGLDYTVKNTISATPPLPHHISGPDLLNGLKDYALTQYGPMAKKLLDEWHIHSCEDFGEIIFNLIDYGVLSKSPTDKREDFKNAYSFHDAFEKPFLPKSNKT